MEEDDNDQYSPKYTPKADAINGFTEFTAASGTS
jgi:hypothetical protein